MVEDCRRRREAGEEPLSDDSLIEAHPDLMPELAAELRTLTWSKADRERAERDEAEVQETTKEGGPGGSSRELHIRCPHCHNPLEIGVDAPLSNIICSCCGSHFGLVDDSRVDDPEEVDGTRKRAIRDSHLPSGLIADGGKKYGNRRSHDLLANC